MSDNYEDILHRPHHQSPTRRRMTMVERGAQFSPFAALTGYEAAIKETGRLTDTRITLSEEEAALLDRKLAFLQEVSGDLPTVNVTYFVPDPQKAGGAYTTLTGRLKRVDYGKQQLVMEDAPAILMADVADITGECFRQMEE